MPLMLVRNDITLMVVDAIANAANTSLAQGGGVCGAIFTAAGADSMHNACSQLAPIQTGEAVITPGFNLPARYVIHTAGPVYDQHSPQQAEQLLRSAYTSSLQRALEQGCNSIAFPLISSGIYGYPKEQALSVACDAIRQFLRPLEDEPEVYLVVFDRDAFGLSRTLMGEVASFVNQYYVDEQQEHFGRHRQLREARPENRFSPEAWRDDVCLKVSGGLDDLYLANRLEDAFEVYLLRLIRTLGMTEVEVYKNANLSRKLFSKIRTGNGYLPGKRTVLALAIGMRLNLEQTQALLQRAGYALAKNQMFDLILEYFISARKYNIHEINAILFKYDQALLGS